MATRPDSDSETDQTWRPPWARGARLVFLILGAELLRMTEEELVALVDEAFADSASTPATDVRE